MASLSDPCLSACVCWNEERPTMPQYPGNQQQNELVDSLTLQEKDGLPA